MAQNLDDAADQFAPDFTYSFLKDIDVNNRPRQIPIDNERLAKMTDMERQFWTIQKDYGDVVLFWAKGSFYELYELNAVIGTREFGLKMAATTRGKMRMAGVPQKAFAEWSRLFVFKGYKVGRVEQMVVEDDGKPHKGVMPRELKVILTRGTLTESNAIAGPEPVYIVSIVPSPVAKQRPSQQQQQQQQRRDVKKENHGGNKHSNNSDADDAYTFDVVAVDLTRQVYHYCPCESVNELVTVLHHMQPKEILVPSLEVKGATNFMTAGGGMDKQQPKGGAAAAAAASSPQEQKSVSDGIKMVCHIVADLLPDCTMERIFSRQTEDLAIAAASRAMSTPPISSSSSGTDTGANLALSTQATAGLPSSWHLVHEYFKYLSIDADRLLPTKFSLGNNETSGLARAADGALPKVKKEKGTNDKDDDDEVVENEFAFKLYTLHQKSSSSSTPSTHTDAALQQQGHAEMMKSMRLLQIERRFDRGLALDAAAIEALDLVVNSRDGTSASTIISWLVGDNKGRTPGAARMLREWLLCPSGNAAVITGRQNAVQLICDTPVELMPLVEGWKRLLEKKGSGGGGAAAAAIAAAAGGDDDDDDNDGDDGDDLDDDDAAGKKKKGGGGPRSHAWIVQSDVAVAGIDFERLLSRISDFKSEDVKVSVVEPLALYPKHLQNIHTALKGFEHLLEFCRAADAAVTSYIGGGNNNNNTVDQTKFQRTQLLRELLADLDKTRNVIRKLLQRFPRDKIVRDGGCLLPEPGANPAYDAAKQQIAAAERTMHDKLLDARRKLNDNKIEFRSVGKEAFLLEIPMKNATPAALQKAGFPKDELVERARTKANVKFAIRPLQDTIAGHKKALLAKDNAIVASLREVAAAICSCWPVLFSAARGVAYLDSLFGLAAASERQQCLGNICFPTFLPQTNNQSNGDDANALTTSIHLQNAYHPLLVLLKRKCVPNTLSLGDVSAAAAIAAAVTAPQQQQQLPGQQKQQQHNQRVMVLTGPNMGGKSSIMRTVAVNVILAQMGAAACATSMTITVPVDRVFTRIGAKDATHRGQSTLFVELSETAAIMREATGRSLCLLDELGRGTSTHDGYAIAHACLRDLAGISCTYPAAGQHQQQQQQQQDQQLLQHRSAVPLVLFATHYHALAVEVSLMEQQQQNQQQRSRIQLAYMDFASGTRRQRTSEGVAELQRDPVTGMKSEKKRYMGGHGDDHAGGGGQEEEQEDAVSVRTDIEMLYKLVPGICARSYGAEVALQAGLPRQLVEKARGVSRQMALVSADHQLLDLKEFLEKTNKNSGGNNTGNANSSSSLSVSEQQRVLEHVRSSATQILAMANAAATAAELK